VQTPTKGPLDRAPASSAAERPERREQDLIVIPEAREPRRWGLVTVIVAGAIALAVIVALTAYATSQRDRANDVDAQLTRALDDQRALLDENTVSRARVTELEARIAALEGDLSRARQGRSVLVASRRETRQQLQDARARLDEAEARFRAFMGPSVGDGTHVGKLIAVGADQEPARLTIDLGRWFTGRDATRAAVHDGVIDPGQRRRRYFRNLDPTWSTLPIDPFPTITIVRWNRVGTTSISLPELQRLSRIGTRRGERVTNDPFAITVTDGRITALRQLRYR
jgi:hypothetical protein